MGAVVTDTFLQYHMEDRQHLGSGTGVVVPIFRGGTGECAPTMKGSHFLPGNLCARLLQGRLLPTVTLQIQEQQCDLHPGWTRSLT